MPEPALRDDGPMLRKIFRKRLKYESPGLHFGALWSSVGPAWEALGDLVDAFCFKRQCAGSAFQILMEKHVLLISTPTSNGIAVFAGPGDRVGASGAPKSHSSGQK